MKTQSCIIKIFFNAIIPAVFMFISLAPIANAQSATSSDPEGYTVSWDDGFKYESKYLPPQLTEFDSLSEFVNNIYKYSMGVIGLVAFGVLAYAGYLRVVSSGNPGNITNSNEWIKSAIYGILLLAAGYIILNTVNPEIVDLSAIDEKINIDKIDVPLSSDFQRFGDFLFGDEDYDMSDTLNNPLMSSRGACSGQLLAACGTWQSQNIIKDTLVETVEGLGFNESDIEFEIPNLCQEGGSARGCVSFVGVQQITLDSIKVMAAKGIPMSITSVTEGSHAQCPATNPGCLSHSAGYKWDMSSRITSVEDFKNNKEYFEEVINKRTSPQGDSIAAYKDKITGAVCYLEKADPESGVAEHWDCVAGS